METPRILVVDDERTITDLVGIYLRNEGYDVTLAHTGADAARLILEREFDLAVLDIMLPDVDGFELLRTIRAERTYPVIMLTARDSQSDKIEGLSLGADDYMVKPFRPLELVARCKAQLRRYTSYGSREQALAAEEAGPLISFNGLSINKEARTVTVDERSVRCTPIEYSILLYLAEHRGCVVPVEELFRAVWDEEFIAGSNNTVMVHIRHLREKLGGMTPRTRASSRTSGASGTPSRSSALRRLVGVGWMRLRARSHVQHGATFQEDGARARQPGDGDAEHAGRECQRFPRART